RSSAVVDDFLLAFIHEFFPENVARLGKTTQSSTYAGSYSVLALDGLLHSWTHTDPETNPWWRVDLLKVYRVNRVTITNRPTFADRINGAVIRIGNFLDIYSNTICGVISTLAASDTATFSCGGMVGRYMVVHIPGDQKILSIVEAGVYGYLAGNRAIGGATIQSCAVIPAIPAGKSYNYSCDGLDGRYVIIHVPGDMKILTLCEVEVYGYLAENLAVAGAAIQSSTSADWFAEKAIDRGLQQLYTGCSSTLNETDPWWRLDLHDVYRVSKVVVTNRNDCCAEQINGAEIRIGNSLEKNGSNNPICAVIPAIPAGESYSYSCDGMEGRYVNLIIPGDMKILTLCEVKVYGEGPCLKRSFVKLLFRSSKDLTDSTMRENVLKQLRSALADRGITDVTLKWSQTPKQEVMRKVNADKSRCDTRR
ncbi:uncharacterized protein LOC131534400, partial [Onychostoma macrolepis]|uniref:uncharacterized protein LOC131534400 n=1 Tax=Onychostoma macrolepis TaxID=369639 RepID=UPI00272C0614